MITFLIDVHGYVPGDKAADITAATTRYVEELEALGVSFPDGDSWNMATVRLAWLHTRVWWEQDPMDPSRNVQRQEGIQVTENLLTGTTVGTYEHLRGR